LHHAVDVASVPGIYKPDWWAWYVCLRLDEAQLQSLPRNYAVHFTLFYRNCVAHFTLNCEFEYFFGHFLLALLVSDPLILDLPPLNRFSHVASVPGIYKPDWWAWYVCLRLDEAQLQSLPRNYAVHFTLFYRNCVACFIHNCVVEYFFGHFLLALLVSDPLILDLPPLNRFSRGTDCDSADRRDGVAAWELEIA